MAEAFTMAEKITFLMQYQEKHKLKIAGLKEIGDFLLSRQKAVFSYELIRTVCISLSIAFFSLSVTFGWKIIGISAKIQTSQWQLEAKRLTAFRDVYSDPSVQKAREDAVSLFMASRQKKRGRDALTAQAVTRMRLDFAREKVASSFERWRREQAEFSATWHENTILLLDRLQTTVALGAFVLLMIVFATATHFTNHLALTEKQYNEFITIAYDIAVASEILP